NDIERATSISRKMVCEWGMSEKLGPITYGKKDQEIFLGREISQHRDYSETMAQEIDNEVKRIVSDAQKRAEKLLEDNIETLHTLAKTLLLHEILDGEQIDQIMKGEQLDSVAFSKSKEKKADESVETADDNTGDGKTEEDKAASQNPNTDGDNKTEQNEATDKGDNSNK
ncbi:MAG: cell division protein FtsH, partial [Caldithrix sp.]|nr:cell division protein FtsH [Caldithrix sp.]